MLAVPFQRRTKGLDHDSPTTSKRLAYAALLTCLGVGIALAPTASADPPARDCPPQGGYRIVLTHGTLPRTCSDAYAIATKLDYSKGKTQQVGQFSCQPTTAVQRGPTGTLFWCTYQGSAFTVYQA